jgi:hypothetical protein
MEPAQENPKKQTKGWGGVCGLGAGRVNSHCWIKPNVTSSPHPLSKSDHFSLGFCTWESGWGTGTPGLHHASPRIGSLGLTSISTEASCF